MRKRFRGNKPISVSTELEAGGDSEGKLRWGEGEGMLYAGRGTYEGTGPRRTDGREERGGEGDEEFERFVRNDGVEDVRRKK